MVNSSRFSYDLIYHAIPGTRELIGEDTSITDNTEIDRNHPS